MIKKTYNSLRCIHANGFLWITTIYAQYQEWKMGRFAASQRTTHQIDIYLPFHGIDKRYGVVNLIKLWKIAKLFTARK